MNSRWLLVVLGLSRLPLWTTKISYRRPVGSNALWHESRPYYSLGKLPSASPASCKVAQEILMCCPWSRDSAEILPILADLESLARNARHTCDVPSSPL